MNPTNRPVDILLNIESPSINLAQRRNTGASSSHSSDVSALNRKENSFDEVYRQQRREDNDVRRPAERKRAAEQPARAEHRPAQTQQQAPAKQAKAESKSDADGKGLPQGSQSNHDQEVKSVAVRESAAANDAQDPAESSELTEDVEVSVSFNVSDLTGTSETEDAATIDGQSDELSVESAQSTEQEVAAEIDSSLLSNAENKVAADAESQQVNAEDLAGKTTEEVDVSQQAVEQNVELEEALPDEESVIAQARQAEAGQQAASQSTDGDVKTRATQASAVTADVAREFKQSRLAEAVENTVKAETTAATKAKATATGSEQTVQPTEDRLAQLSSKMDFKVLREQLAAGTVKVDSASAGTAKTGAVEGASTADGGDRQQRLNGLAQASQALTQQAKPGVVSASVQQPVGSSEWGQAMSQRIMWLANRGISAAELQLNPRDLGPVDVRINVSGEQATVQFSSQNAQVREALESSSVRLREMMESSGLNLADVDVSDQSQSEQALADSGDNSGGAGGGESGGDEAVAEAVISERIESNGLVDFYA